MAAHVARNQNPGQQSNTSTSNHNPPLTAPTATNPNGGSTPRLPVVPMKQSARAPSGIINQAIPNPLVQQTPDQHELPKTRTYSNRDVIGDVWLWAKERDKLPDGERVRLEGIDEMVKLLDDPAWYYWPTWTEAIGSGRHGTEEELRASTPRVRWTKDIPMSEMYPRPPQSIQEAIEKYYPLKMGYYAVFIDRPLNDLGTIINQSYHKLVWLVGEDNGTTPTTQEDSHIIYDRCPKRGETYRHIMFPFNKYSWLASLPFVFSDTRLYRGLDHSPLRAYSRDQGYFNSFLKPAVECQPSVGKVLKLTLSIPILCIKKGQELMDRKLSEKVLHHHPHFLRAPGYEYNLTYIGEDGRMLGKPQVWDWTTLLDDSTNHQGPYIQNDPSKQPRYPPTVWSGRSLFEYHHPKVDTLFLDLRQTMRRGNRGDWANDDFLMVEQLWAVIVPENETLVTFQSLKLGFIPGQVGGYDVHNFEPHKGTEVIPQGPVHDLFLFFADLVLLSHYQILDVFRAGTAYLNFRVANEATRDSKLIEDCNTIISELSIIIEVTNKQIELLYGVKQTMLLEGSVRPEERKAALEFYKFLVDRLEVVVSAFTDIQAEAKQAQTLLFQLLNSEASKQQARMATQQALIAEQTAQETAIQLELSKRTSEQNKSFLVFTIITTIFLPLSFFTSYFGMNTKDIRDMDRDQMDFWQIAGPTSAAIILIAMCWAFRMKLQRGMRMIFKRSYQENIHDGGKSGASNLEKGISVRQQQKNPWYHFGKNRVEKND